MITDDERAIHMGMMTVDDSPYLAAVESLGVAEAGGGRSSDDNDELSGSLTCSISCSSAFSSDDDMVVGVKGVWTACKTRHELEECWRWRALLTKLAILIYSQGRRSTRDPRTSLPLAMSSLQGYVDRKVLLVLQDGRAIVVRAHTSCSAPTHGFPGHFGRL